MPSNPVSSYRNVPGRAFGLTGYHRLWLGDTHLLQMEQSGYAENYHRFYFKDIQALVVQPTNGRRNWNLAFAGFAMATLLFVGLLALGIEDRAVLLVIGMILLSPWLLALLLNSAAGPACKTLLVTAVQTAALPSASRVRRAQQLLDLLGPEIRAAQAVPAPQVAPAVEAPAVESLAPALNQEPVE